MKLKKLLNKIDYTLIKGELDIELKDISYDSRKVEENDLYLAIVGSNVDGHKYIEEAINKGAKCLVVSSDLNLDNQITNGITIVKVENTNKILSRLSMNLFDNSHEKIIKIAITGTKGKTTTSFMIKKILETNGQQCGIIGTNGIYLNKKHIKTQNTTPSAYDTLKYIDMMVKEGIEYLVMEVSSQALKYDRVNDIEFDYGIFTNLSEDHIGKNEHTDMEDYIKSKAKLFKQTNTGIFNLDSDYFFQMVDSGNSSINTYGYHEKADLKATNIELYREKDKLGINLTLKGIINDKFKISIPGKFSSYNAMAAIYVTHLLGVPIDKIKEALNDFSVRGRVENIPISDKFSLIIDYAHNGLSTENILHTIKEYNPKRIITIFGCGGERSITRRYEMGEACGKYSDYCIITEDNNRNEDFNNIAKDILVGINKTKCKYEIIDSRKEAIKYAIKNAQPGDIIMLLGKGHEDYIEVSGKRIPFDERKVIENILKELNLKK